MCTVLPDRSSTESMTGDLGPVTTTSATGGASGARMKSTISLACLGHPQVDGNISKSLGDTRNELVPCRRDDHERERAIAELRGQLRVQILLDDPDQVGGVAAFATHLVEVERAAVRGQHPDAPLLQHHVEIAKVRSSYKATVGGQRAGRIWLRLARGRLGRGRASCLGLLGGRRHRRAGCEDDECNEGPAELHVPLG